MGILSLYAISVNPFLPVVTVHARVPSNGICRGFTFKYGKFLLPLRFLTALSVPKVPTRELYLPVVTVHAYVPSNRICRGFAFKYGKFLLPPRFLTALSVPKVPTRELYLPVPYM